MERVVTGPSFIGGVSLLGVLHFCKSYHQSNSVLYCTLLLAKCNAPKTTCFSWFGFKRLWFKPQAYSKQASTIPATVTPIFFDDVSLLGALHFCKSYHQSNSVLYCTLLLAKCNAPNPSPFAFSLSTEPITPATRGQAGVQGSTIPARVSPSIIGDVHKEELFLLFLIFLLLLILVLAFVLILVFIFAHLVLLWLKFRLVSITIAQLQQKYKTPASSPRFDSAT